MMNDDANSYVFMWYYVYYGYVYIMSILDIYICVFIYDYRKNMYIYI